VDIGEKVGRGGRTEVGIWFRDRKGEIWRSGRELGRASRRGEASYLAAIEGGRVEGTYGTNQKSCVVANIKKGAVMMPVEGPLPDRIRARDNPPL
jgi:hypothetical protein